MTDPNEFIEFHNLLMSDSPADYVPYYFVLEPNDKNPHLVRGSWKNEKNRVTVEQATSLLRRGFNVGIAGTEHDPLVIIDIDDETRVPASELKPTLSVRSRSRTGCHYFYFTSSKKAKINVPTDESGEIRSNWQYVVAPGSWVTTDPANVPADQQDYIGRYTIENAVSPTSITYDEFPQIFRDQHEQDVSEPIQRSQPSGRKSGSALFALTITDVVRAPSQKARFASVFHGSDTGANTSISRGMLQCWRHNCSHTPLTVLAVLSGMFTCIEAGYPHRGCGGGSSSLDVSDGESMFRLWSYARDNRMIPYDDVPPSCVLVWYALKENRFDKDYLIDGWQLPSNIYKWVVAELLGE